MNTNERYTVHIDMPQGVALAHLFGELRASGYSVRCTGPATYIVQVPVLRQYATVHPIRPTSPEAA